MLRITLNTRFIALAAAFGVALFLALMLQFFLGGAAQAVTGPGVTTTHPTLQPKDPSKDVKAPNNVVPLPAGPVAEDPDAPGVDQAPSANDPGTSVSDPDGAYGAQQPGYWELFRANLPFVLFLIALICAATLLWITFPGLDAFKRQASKPTLKPEEQKKPSPELNTFTGTLHK